MILCALPAAKAEIITQWDYSGTFMFTVSGNDSQILRGGNSVDLIRQMNDWFSEVMGMEDYVTYFNTYGKNEGNSNNNGLLALSFADKSRDHGTWTSIDPIEFYAVKAGNSFALYWLGEPPTT